MTNLNEVREKMLDNSSNTADTKNKSLFDMMPDWLVYSLASSYLAGQTSKQAIELALKLYSQNQLSATLDILGEDCQNDNDCDGWVNEYINLIDDVAQINNSFNSKQQSLTISFKPSMFSDTILSGLDKRNTKSLKAYERIKKVVTHGFEKNVNLTLEAEDHRWTDFHLDTYFDLFDLGLTNLGTVIQTRLKRTHTDIERFNTGHRVRLVIGIYNEPNDIAYVEIGIMKNMMLKYSKILLDKNVYVEFASHDTNLLAEFLNKVVKNDKINRDRFETQYLKGVPRNSWQMNLVNGKFFQNNDFDQSLKQFGSVVRMYLPYGKPSVASAYCKRRLKGNPNLITYGIKNILGIEK